MEKRTPVYSQSHDNSIRLLGILLFPSIVLGAGNTLRPFPQSTSRERSAQYCRSQDFTKNALNCERWHVKCSVEQ